MTLAQAPLYDRLIDEQDKANLNWTIFFQNLSNGDAGQDWDPVIQNIGVVGTPIVTGRLYQISKYLCYFTVVIDPNGGNTTSSVGTTYVENFPLPFAGDGVVFAVSGNLGDGPGMVVGNSGRIYPPSWSSVSVPITLIGICEVE